MNKSKAKKLMQQHIVIHYQQFHQNAFRNLFRVVIKKITNDARRFMKSKTTMALNVKNTRYNYGPWGETDIVHDDDGSGVANPIRFTGREMDETGL